MLVRYLVFSAFNHLFFKSAVGLYFKTSKVILYQKIKQTGRVLFDGWFTYQAAGFASGGQ
jgi:hypothetical protein